MLIYFISFSSGVYSLERWFPPLNCFKLVIFGEQHSLMGAKAPYRRLYFDLLRFTFTNCYMEHRRTYSTSSYICMMYMCIWDWTIYSIQCNNHDDVPTDSPWGTLLKKQVWFYCYMIVVLIFVIRTNARANMTLKVK